MNRFIACTICLLLFGLTEAQYQTCSLKDGETKICEASDKVEPYGNLTYKINPNSQGGGQICCQVLGLKRGIVVDYVGNTEEWTTTGCGRSTKTVKWEVYGKPKIKCSANANSETPQSPIFTFYSVQWEANDGSLS
uniref:Secreted protein n=1 Tax=Plectus sambesii TaxID=2011161 RepID=A0A914WNS5_9BILA